MNELSIAPWPGPEDVDTRADPASSADERIAAPRHCLCGQLLPPHRRTCSMPCKVRRDGLLKRVARRQLWIGQWDALRGRSAYSTVEIDREITALEEDIRELLKAFQTGPQGGRPANSGSGPTVAPKC